MTDFRVDREALPQPWANPLIFLLSDGGATIEVEVEQIAAIEYKTAWRAGGIAFALAPQRAEYFVESVENAVNHRMSAGGPHIQLPIVLRWADLNL